MELSKYPWITARSGSHEATTKYVGLDVHQATTVAAVREESGRVIARSIVPTEATALVEFFRAMRGSIHVAFEEGTQAQWLLRSAGARRGSRDRLRSPRAAEQGNKADQLDASSCRSCCGAVGLRAVYHGSARSRGCSKSWRGRIRIWSRTRRG